MAVGGFFKFAQRALFSKPTPERQLLKLVKAQPIRRVVELGVESLAGTQQLLTELVKQADAEQVSYTAIDPFDVRDASLEPVTLVAAHRGLAALGAKVRLSPGPIGPGVAREANSLSDTDLLLLSRAADDGGLDDAWFYVPRMCHPGTLVLKRVDGADEEDPGAWEVVSLEVVAARAAAFSPGRAAA